MDKLVDKVMSDVLRNGEKLVSANVPGYDDKDTRSTDSPSRTGEYDSDYTTVAYGKNSDGVQQVTVTGHRAPVIEPTPIDIDPSIFDLPDFWPSEPTPAPKVPKQTPNVRLGNLSMKYETRMAPSEYRKAAGVVSSGRGDPGGISYGAYQLASNVGKVQDFLKTDGSSWASRFAGMDPHENWRFRQYVESGCRSAKR